MSDPRAGVRPEVKAFFDLLAQGRAERVLEPGALRAGFSMFEPLLTAGAPEVAEEREVRIPSTPHGLRAVAYRPEATGPLPILLFLHGGGFVVMSPESHAKLAKRLAVGAGALVVSLEYRLAPEHPYPDPLDDCVAAFGWLRKNAGSLGGDPARLAIAGDSAGGNLSAATTLRLMAAGEEPPAGAVLICPWTDLHLATGSYRTLAPDDPVIDAEIMQYFRTSYAARSAQWDDPFVSPLRADLSGFPPSCVIAAELDPLFDEGCAFAEKARAAGCDSVAHTFAGMPHDFMLFLEIEESARAIDAMCEFLRGALR
jgi:acetyl esterase